MPRNHRSMRALRGLLACPAGARSLDAVVLAPLHSPVLCWNGLHAWLSQATQALQTLQSRRQLKQAVAVERERDERARKMSPALSTGTCSTALHAALTSAI